jgi:hypothetical protein
MRPVGVRTDLECCGGQKGGAGAAAGGDASQGAEGDWRHTRMCSQAKQGAALHAPAVLERVQVVQPIRERLQRAGAQCAVLPSCCHHTPLAVTYVVGLWLAHIQTALAFLVFVLLLTTIPG